MYVEIMNKEYILLLHSFSDPEKLKDKLSEKEVYGKRRKSWTFLLLLQCLQFCCYNFFSLFFFSLIVTIFILSFVVTKQNNINSYATVIMQHCQGYCTSRSWWIIPGMQIRIVVNFYEKLRLIMLLNSYYRVKSVLDQ